MKNNLIICNKYSKWVTINKILSPLQNLGANIIIRPHGFKVVDNNSDYEEHEISDDEEDLNNNQSLLSNYKATDNDTNSSECSRFFDCLTLRRNYKRNRKKPFSKKGQFSSSSSTTIWQKYPISFLILNLILSSLTTTTTMEKVKEELLSVAFSWLNYNVNNTLLMLVKAI